VKAPWSLLALALAASCATSNAPEQPPAKVLAMAPIPFTAAQIHDASRAGKTYRWQLEVKDKPTVRKQLRFDAVDDEGATVSSLDTDETGKVLDQQTGKPTWNQLRMHGAFPADITTVEEKQVTVPAGTCQCKWYTVREDDDAIVHFCFVLEEPGPPFYFDQWRGDVQVMKSELIELIPGG
jgi:hypothetical protein